MAKSSNKNAFLDTLEYPSHGHYAKFPYPAFDTGIEVTAMNFGGNPWDEEGKSDDPLEVRGNLLIRPSPFGGFQCFVRAGDEDHPVDPETVRPTTNPQSKPREAVRRKRGSPTPKADTAAQKPKAIAEKDIRTKQKPPAKAIVAPSKRKARKPKSGGRSKQK